MSMKGFFETFSKSKIPSLVLIALIFGTGVYLVKGETGVSSSVISGGIILIVGTTLAIFSFADYRKREEADNIIKGYDTALKSISKTHSVFEKTQQNTLAAEQKIGGHYTIEDQDKTLDN